MMRRSRVRSFVTHLLPLPVLLQGLEVEQRDDELVLVQLAVAVWLGGVRLLDNVRIDPTEATPELITQPAAASPAAESHEVPAVALYAKPSDR